MRTVGRWRSLFTIWAVIASTARRSLSGQPPEPPFGAGELGGANRLGAGAERRDGRHDGKRRLPFPEPLRLGRDDALRPHRLGAAARQGCLDDRLQIVDVVDEAPVDGGQRRVDVARHGEVDEQERPAAARAERRRQARRR